IEDGAQLITATLGDGSGATLTAKSSLIELKGTSADGEWLSAISSSVLLAEGLPTPTGDGGKINLETGQLSISDGAQVIVSNAGLGDAGDINIVSSSIELSDRGQLLAETAFGEGGNINLKIDDTLTMGNNSLISAQAFNNANGGNVNIDANFIVAFPNQIDGNGNDIIASAAEGNGGEITINTESLLGIEARKAVDNNRTNDIDASSEFGLDGTVAIFTPDINPVQGATELPSTVVEAEQTSAQACQASRETEAKNSLIVRGKGGIPATPVQPLTSQNLIINGEITSASAIPEPIKTSQGKIQLARGIKFTDDGRVILTAYPTNNAGERLPEGRVNCS
ncbi:MAG: filamentous hemagglutinin N-terminal domain-containing protein, partial [Waterburya sp.]